MITVIANAFGILSTICFIVSFQADSNRKLYLSQSAANVFYGTQFYLLGATGGLFNMGMQIVRNLLLCRRGEWKWLQHPLTAPLMCLPSLIYMIACWSGPLDLLPFIAMTAGTLGYFTDDARILRLAELICVSPAWLMYDLCQGAYGGVLNEAVILGSVVFSIIRFGWAGLAELNGSKGRPALDGCRG